MISAMIMPRPISWLPCGKLHGRRADRDAGLQMAQHLDDQGYRDDAGDRAEQAPDAAYHQHCNRNESQAQVERVGGQDAKKMRIKRARDAHYRGTDHKGDQPDFHDPNGGGTRRNLVVARRAQHQAKARNLK